MCSNGIMVGYHNKYSDTNMTKGQLNTPVLLLGFIRSQTAQKVFNEIKKVKPKKFFLAVDGPRSNKPEDKALCQKTRDIAKQIDWECEVKTLFQEKNLGCGLETMTAINWFFENVDEGIIFDDDCIPDQSFFYFCQELLEYYKDNEKIMHISGDNFQEGKKRGNSSYYFSQYTHNWGWATWKRAWKYFDFDIAGPEKKKHTWDTQWHLSVKKHHGLAILPNVNLISNIGFNNGATHTSHESKFSNMPTEAMVFPIIHPKKINRNLTADFFTYCEVFGGSVRKIVFHEITKIIPRHIKDRVKNFIRPI